MSESLQAIIAWLIPLLESSPRRIFMLGLSGVQGSGKSTLVTNLQKTLIHHGHRTAQVSLDDFYLTARDQMRLCEQGNTLWESRGQFGTHDLILAQVIMMALKGSESAIVKVPVYDKSQCQGRGDRAPEEAWPECHVPCDVIILEGWGIGFEALSEAQLTRACDIAVTDASTTATGSQVARRSRRDLKQVNNALREYNRVFMGPQHFDGLVVLKAENTDFVYKWRLEQEHAMWTAKGTGMSDEEVRAFVDRYYSSYELYLPKMFQGFFERSKQGRQINLTLDAQRTLAQVQII